MPWRGTQQCTCWQGHRSYRLTSKIRSEFACSEQRPRYTRRMRGARLLLKAKCFGGGRHRPNTQRTDCGIRSGCPREVSHGPARQTPSSSRATDEEAQTGWSRPKVTQQEVAQNLALGGGVPAAGAGLITAGVECSGEQLFIGMTYTILPKPLRPILLT